MIVKEPVELNCLKYVQPELGDSVGQISDDNEEEEQEVIQKSIRGKGVIVMCVSANLFDQPT